MKPLVKIAAARTAAGLEMCLYQHDSDFSITIKGQELMNSRRNNSEMELARLGCAALTSCTEPAILIGGLGLGYTLRQTLDMVGSHAKVVVAELLRAVVDWNRDYVGELTGRPLEDERVELQIGDIVDFISQSPHRFDAILLDIDNGPDALTDVRNHRLYNPEGIRACRRALKKNGCLAVWSGKPSRRFERLLMSCDFHVRRYRVPAYKGSRSQSCFVWVASEDKKVLPPGGGEPSPPGKKESGKG